MKSAFPSPCLSFSPSSCFLLSAYAVISLWDEALCLSILTCMQSTQWICFCVNDRHLDFSIQSEDGTYFSPPLPACLSKFWKGVLDERPSASSDLSQSSHFHYSNHIFHLLSDPLLLHDRLPSCTRGKLSFLRQRTQLRVTIHKYRFFNLCTLYIGYIFFLIKQLLKISKSPNLETLKLFWKYFSLYL